MRPSTSLFTVCMILLSGIAGAADLKVAAVFSDHVVLQRDKPVAIWGWADDREGITVSFAGQSKQTVAGSDGKWRVTLDALTASADPRDLTVSSSAKPDRRVVIHIAWSAKYGSVPDNPTWP